MKLLGRILKSSLSSLPEPAIAITERVADTFRSVAYRQRSVPQLRPDTLHVMSVVRLNNLHSSDTEMQGNRL
jgi:hypothetical protein